MLHLQLFKMSEFYLLVSMSDYSQYLSKASIQMDIVLLFPIVTSE